jgi:hypothetical protein
MLNIITHRVSGEIELRQGPTPSFRWNRAESIISRLIFAYAQGNGLWTNSAYHYFWGLPGLQTEFYSKFIFLYRKYSVCLRMDTTV